MTTPVKTLPLMPIVGVGVAAAAIAVTTLIASTVAAWIALADMDDDCSLFDELSFEDSTNPYREGINQ